VTPMPAIHIEEIANAAAGCGDDVVLSVLIPFYGDDPTRLAASLNALIGTRKTVEILLLDDGSPETTLNAGVARTVRALSAPARLLTSTRNMGRSSGRNLLAAKARGRWLLYLDADMQPGNDAFLQAYLERIESDDFDAAFGGYETVQPDDPVFDVHAALSRASDHTDAEAREHIGATAFCSSNLLVRARVMRDVRFDESFTGWGWEDVDWAVRAARAHRLVHLDNPAWHDGLQGADGLLSKFRAGAVNYARLLEKHPQLARLPGARAARTLAAIPLQRAMRGVFADLVRSQRLPMKVRTTALKLWRASWTAEAIG
jgi:glycosyltransferase involved in cell wall biosynthesis